MIVYTWVTGFKFKILLFSGAVNKSVPNGCNVLTGFTKAIPALVIKDLLADTQI
jgi:hypothetical protein